MQKIGGMVELGLGSLEKLQAGRDAEKQIVVKGLPPASPILYAGFFGDAAF